MVGPAPRLKKPNKPINIRRIVTLICMPMAIGQSVHKLWIYGEFMCKMTTYMQGVSVSASVFTLMVLSVDRFLAIRHPMTFRSFSASRYAVSILTCLWILATGTMVPLMLVRRIQTVSLAHHVEPLHFCTEIWRYAHGRRIYDAFLFVFMFVMPGCFITASYSLIGCKLWTEKEQIHRRDSRAGREQTEKVMAGRRRVARMLAALAIVFACCWLPYHLHNLYLDFAELHAVAAIEALPFTILLGHANSAFNPILYCFMNKNFRKATARLLHIGSGIRKKGSKKDPVNVVVRYQVTNTSRPVSNKLIQRPLLRPGSSISMTAASRSTGSSRITRSTPNSFRTGLTSSRRHQDYANGGALYSHVPVSDRILQNEVFPSKPLTFRPKCCAHPVPDKANCPEPTFTREAPAQTKREMFDFTLSIPTTIQEESSRSARSVSPNGERRSTFFGNDSTVIQFEEQRQLPAKVVTSVLKEQSDRYKENPGYDVDDDVTDDNMDQIDIEIHVSSEDVPVITCDEID
ncbi:hypothetical protein LSH36_196g00008 [Paralvinella palmiformis]|uniref:G-protein coupled receptors family 1 profile domain-containing protein n=1 Tax=Paralvinella palmiformis TaxID=53620 RepID=A0AAD9JQN4_9ANNE|nr:hypothetical protein LSH36_196g00008 [Paralvinella palmiformis]